MLDAVLLVMLNLVFIYLLVSLMEKRVHKFYRNKYGAQIEDFKSVISSIKNFEFDKIPEPQRNNDTVYNDLLIVTASYLKAYLALDNSKNQLVEFSMRNKALIKTYIDVLNSLKLSTAKFKDVGGESEAEIVNVINKIDESVRELSK